MKAVYYPSVEKEFERLFHTAKVKGKCIDYIEMSFKEFESLAATPNCEKVAYSEDTKTHLINWKLLRGDGLLRHVAIKVIYD